MIIKPIEFNDVEFLRCKDKYWMQELNTIFPYGLNDRIEINGIMEAYDYVTRSSYNLPIYTLLNFVKNNRTKKGSGHRTIYAFDATSFVDNILSNTGTSISKECCKQIMSVDNPHVYELITSIVNLRISHHHQFKYNENLLFMIEDLCFYKLAKVSSKVNKYSTYITILYTNKLIDNINLTKLLRSPESFASFPANSDILKNIGISYKYTPTIRNKITNYKATINSLTDSYACSGLPQKNIIQIPGLSRTFQDIFLVFPGLWPALFQDFSRTVKQIPGLFQDFSPKSRTLIDTKYT